ncbi:MAG: DUF1254 domain-containing protein [Methyloligellaceae bacterium]
MSQVKDTVRNMIPEKIKQFKGALETPQAQHARHPSDTPVWQFIKKYAAKFWKWLKADNWKWVIATIVIAGIVHILAVLNLPSLAPKSAWFRLRNDVPVNKMLLLAKLDEKPSLLPMMAPDVRYAICRYDLSKGPVTIRSKIPNALFSVAAYDQLGQNFYVITGASLQREELYLVVTQNSNTAEEEVSASEKSDDVVVINSAGSKGVLLLRAPIAGPAYELQTEELLKNATCSAE